MRQLSRLLGALLIVLLSQVAVSHAAPEKPSTLTQPPLPPGMGEYIMVLWPPGSPVPTQSGPPVTVNAPEPDVAKLGGRVLGQHDNKRYILLPLTAAGELRRNRAVAFLQRVWRGESLVGWHEMLSVSTTSAPSKHKLRASPNDTGTNLQWGPKAYTYDGSGNITAIGADQYVYDTAERLVRATLGSKTETYQYDAFGNLTQKGVTGYSPTVIQVDSGSNRLSGVSYDAAGNVLEAENGKRTYQYDSLGALTRTNSMAGDRRILYDANDERIGTVLVSGPYEDIARWTIRDFDGRLIREYKSDEGGLAYWTWEEDHFYGEDGLLGGEAVTFCLEGDECWGGRRHYHLDHLGSVRLMTDDTRLPAHARALSAHDYLPFGQTVTQTYQEQIDWGDPHIDGMRFAGHWRDFLGAINVDNTEYIDYMHARHYDPYLGRFLSVDPVLGDPARPQSWNRYAYVQNNPMRYTDPTGKSLWEELIRVVRYIGRDEKVVARISEIGKNKTMQRIEQGIKAAREEKATSVAVVTETKEARNAVGKQLAENGKIRGPERSGIWPEHVNPDTGPHSDIHVQTVEDTKSAGFGKSLGMGILAIIGANTMAANANKDASAGEIVGAFAWDTAKAIDPIFVTDVIEHFSGIGEYSEQKPPE